MQQTDDCPGVFVTFEGGDHAGKSTQVSLLAAWLSEQTARRVVTTREPGGTAIGETLRSIVLHGHGVDARTEVLLYAADRAQHVAQVVLPSLEAGAVVISDRYLDSSVAYQAAGRKLPPEEIEQISRWATGGLMPHLTILLDLDPAQAVLRRQTDPDRIEAIGGEFPTRVRAAFLGRAEREPGRWAVIDARRSIEHIAADVRRVVAARLGERLGLGLVPDEGSGKYEW